MKYGCVPDARDDRDRKFSLQPPDDYVVPDEHSLLDWFCPVMDQGGTNSCTVHAVTAAYRYNLIDTDLADVPLSRAQLYWDAGVIEGDTSDNGRQLRDVVKAAAKTGMAKESLWGFDKIGQQPTPEVYADAANQTILEYQAVEINRQALNTAIYVGHPLIIAIPVFLAFESDEVMGTGIVPMPKTGETEIGWHAMLMGAYGARDIVLNSWNTWFGLPERKGYCSFPNEYIPKLASSIWTIFVNSSKAVAT